MLCQVPSCHGATEVTLDATGICSQGTRGMINGRTQVPSKWQVFCWAVRCLFRTSPTIYDDIYEILKGWGAALETGSLLIFPMVLYDFFRSPNTPNYRVTLQTQRPLHTVFLVDYYFSRDLYLGGFGWGRPTIPPKYFSIIWEGVEYICQNYFAMHLSSEIISTYLAHTFVQIILEGYNTFKMNYRNKSKQITVFGTYLTNSTQNRKPSSDFLFSPTGHRDFYSHSTHPKILFVFTSLPLSSELSLWLGVNTWKMEKVPRKNYLRGARLLHHPSNNFTFAVISGVSRFFCWNYLKGFVYTTRPPFK